MMQFFNTLKIMKYFVILILSLTCYSCADIIDGLAQNNIKGTWNLITIEDVATGNITDVSEFSISTRILGNKEGNAIFFDGSNFNVFYQIEGNTSEIDGSYTVDITKLTLDFNDNTKLVRSINSVGETELILSDTIASKAKTLTFVK
jgi:hypothetical protein